MSTSKHAPLGFGLMRLPQAGEGIDVEQTARMVDAFLAAGFTYFDTAYVYNGSEEAARKALVERHPRESYTLATKLNARVAKDAADARSQLDQSLARTGAGYFDYYLLHALQDSNVRSYDAWGLWDFVKEQKAAGRIRHYGFSFHGTPALLDRLLTEHPDVDFVQLQINYADWENPEVTSGENYAVARRHGKQVVIMEPVKGGSLADPPQAVKELFDAARPGASYASWALRFAASLDGVLAVLSGMSNTAQMEDNLATFTDFAPMDEADRAVIARAQQVLARSAAIPCTGCGYCVEGCPQQIFIPKVFAAANRQLAQNDPEKAKKAYAEATDGRGRASDCIGCGQCEGACPQHLPVIGVGRTAQLRRKAGGNLLPFITDRNHRSLRQTGEIEGHMPMADPQQCYLQMIYAHKRPSWGSISLRRYSADCFIPTEASGMSSGCHLRSYSRESHPSYPRSFTCRRIWGHGITPSPTMRVTTLRSDSSGWDT